MSIKKFRNNSILKFIALMLFVMPLQSCIYLVVGGVGVLGGYIVSPDTVEGMIEVDIESLWDTTVEIVSIMGIIEEQDDHAMMIQSVINDAKITISVIEVNESTVKLSVKARKHMLPRVSIAQDVYAKIVSHML